MIEWHADRLTMDSKCILKDDEAEAVMRPILADYIDWLNSEDE